MFNRERVNLELSLAVIKNTIFLYDSVFAIPLWNLYDFDVCL